MLFCDDFEDGHWYDFNEAIVTQSTSLGGFGGDFSVTKGWSGTVYADSYIPSNTQCGGQGAAGSSCSAYSGSLPGPNPDNTGNMARHGLGPNYDSYNEVYFRWYMKYSADHTLNPQKTLTINSTSLTTPGITIGGFGNGGGWASMCPVYDCNALDRMNPENTPWPNSGCQGGMDMYLCQNQPNRLTFDSVKGHWLYMEMHIKMNTAGAQNGVYDLWMNDCGASGVCSGSPTLRAHFDNVGWQSGSSPVQTIWIENQSPPDAVTHGAEWYDQIKAAKVGPIGFSR